MKKTTLVFSFFMLLLFSCKKDEPECTTATVKFSCTSSNPYNLYINGAFQKQIKGGESQTYTLEEGTYKFHAEQVSGFVLFPTTKTEDVAVFGCKSYSWAFP